MGECQICGKDMEGPMGHGQHAKKHQREFAEETGYSRNTDYEIVKAFYQPENAAAWAKQIVDQLKDAGRMPLQENLEDFTDSEGESG